MKSPKNRHTTSGGPPPYPIGYKLYEVPPKKLRIPLKINELTNGLYFISIKQKNGSTSTYKFIKN